MKLVRECLRVHVGARCPGWIDDLMWQHRCLRSYEQVVIAVSAIWHVNPSLFHEWKWLDESSTDKDEDAQVTVKLRITDEQYLWRIECVQGSILLDYDEGWSDPWLRLPEIRLVLGQIRRYFARDDAKPSGAMEVPTTLQEWRSFISLWLFSEAPGPQPTLSSWLSPAGYNGERCHECGKHIAPGQQLFARGVARPFCSQRCVAASTTLSCRIERWESLATLR